MLSHFFSLTQSKIPDKYIYIMACTWDYPLPPLDSSATRLLAHYTFPLQTMAKKYFSKSRTMKENLAPPKSGKGTKVATKIMVSMTEKTWATSNSESLNSSRSVKHCSHFHCRDPQDEKSKGHRCAEVEDSKPRFVDDSHPTILPTNYEHYFHREDQQEDWSELHKEDLQSNGRRWRIE